MDLMWFDYSPRLGFMNGEVMSDFSWAYKPTGKEINRELEKENEALRAKVAELERWQELEQKSGQNWMNNYMHENEKTKKLAIRIIALREKLNEITKLCSQDACMNAIAVARDALTQDDEMRGAD